MIKPRQAANESMAKLINDSLKVIELSKKGGLMSKDEALDALWELIINIEYEVKNGKCIRIEALMN